MKRLLFSIAEYCGEHFPKQYLKLRYFIRFKKRLDFKQPKNLNEKILYLSMFTDTSKWTELADKYLVRQYVTDIIGGGILTNLYNIYSFVAGLLLL